MGKTTIISANPGANRQRLTLVEDDGDLDIPARASTRNGPPAAPAGQWKIAMDDFLLAVRAELEERTAEFYQSRITILSRWACQVANSGDGVALGDFKARHLRQFLQYRAEQISQQTGKPVCDATRRHDAISARKFLKFCHKEDYIETNPLSDYAIPKASRAYVECPKVDDVARLLVACRDRWKVERNPNCRFMRKAGREFFSRRNYAILCGLVATSCRIGEMLELKMADFNAEARTVVFRDTKGDEDRLVPFEAGWGEAVAAWLRVRPASSPADTLFITEYGTAVQSAHFRRQFYKDRELAGLPHLNMHHIRHFSLTQLSHFGLKETSKIAGHKSLATTQIYVHTDEDRMREVQAVARPLGQVLVNTRSKKNRKKVV